jgi:putative ABC transport system ATP-binding protein
MNRGIAMRPLIQVVDLWRRYQLGDCIVEALRGVTVDFYKGEFTLLLGPSGSGKSSLLHLLGAMDHPSSGTVHYDGIDLSSLGQGRQTDLRLRKIGFVFQTFNLLPTLNVLENVALPMRFAGVNQKNRNEKAAHLLEKVGLGDRLGHLPKQLSGGQRQRVAIARSLANEPALILADEPTGNLDTHSGEQVIDLLLQLRNEGKTVVMVTHNTEYTALADRTVMLRDGQIAAGPVHSRAPSGVLGTI